ncbi:hypothetical protein ACXWPE_09565, partial [Streptococcus pyogenes]
INLLDVLGIWEPLRPFAEPVRRIEITDSSLTDGIRPTYLTYDNMLPSGDAATVIIENVRLEQALLDALSGAKGVRVLGGTRIE